MPIFLPCNEKVPAKAYECYPLRWPTWHAAFVTFTFVFDPTSFKCAALEFYWLLPTRDTKIVQIFVWKIGESNIICAATLWLFYFILQCKIISYKICVIKRWHSKTTPILRTFLVIVGEGFRNSCHQYSGLSVTLILKLESFYAHWLDLGFSKRVTRNSPSLSLNTTVSLTWFSLRFGLITIESKEFNFKRWLDQKKIRTMILKFRYNLLLRNSPPRGICNTCNR